MMNECPACKGNKQKWQLVCGECFHKTEDEKCWIVPKHIPEFKQRSKYIRMAVKKFIEREEENV